MDFGAVGLSQKADNFIDAAEGEYFMEIRLAQIDDIGRINHLLYQVHAVHAKERPDLFIPGEKKYTDEELSELMKDESRPIYVACVEGEVKGYAFCILQQASGNNMVPVKTMYIDDLCVDEAARGQHIGRSLYEHVLDEAKRLGCYNVTLNVWECNPTARKFYEACGLQVLKTGMEMVL